MFTHNTTFLIIDDNETDLDILRAELEKCHIYSYALKYDPRFNKPLQGVRILFLDYNLTGGEMADPITFSTLSKAISSYISLDNGPFSIVFWTNTPKKIDDFINHLNERDEVLPKPFSKEVMDKNEFINMSQSEKITFLEKIVKDTGIGILYDFEDRLRKGASQTLNKLINLIPYDKKQWGREEEFIKKMKQTFAVISKTATSHSIAKENPRLGIDHTLAQIFLYHYIHENTEYDWKNELSQFLKDPDLKLIPDIDKGKLNSFLHTTISNATNTERGKLYRISPNSFKSATSVDHQEWLVNRIIKKKITDKGKEPHEDVKLDQLNTVCMEFSAACDDIQQKDRIKKYLLGVLIPKDSFKSFIDNSYQSSRIELPEFHVNENNYRIIFDPNYISTRLPTDAEYLLTFNNEIMIYIMQKYVNQNFRMGITSFEEKH